MKLSYVNLYVSDVRQSIAFYERAFGLTLRFLHESGHYAEMETGKTTLAFCQHELAQDLHPGFYEKSTAYKAPLGAQISFEPEDVKAAYNEAVAAGAFPYSKPERMPWGCPANGDRGRNRLCRGNTAQIQRNGVRRKQPQDDGKPQLPAAQQQKTIEGNHRK